MKVLSFDIGIKNLAFCILNTNPNACSLRKECVTISQPITNHFPIERVGEEDLSKKYCAIAPTIMYWDCINVVKDEPIPCAYQLHGKQICSKPSCLYVLRIPENILLEHQQQQKNGKKKKLKVRKKDMIKVYYCKSHSKLLSHNEEKIPIKKMKVNKMPIEKIARGILDELDKRPYLLEVDEVLLENQPVLKNPRMKFVQSVVYTYFMMRGMIDKEKRTNLIEPIELSHDDEDRQSEEIEELCDDSKIAHISLISARNKLKVYLGPVIACSIKSKYARTKKLSILYTQSILNSQNNNRAYLPFFASHKKKDDLADSYLQGLYYLSRK